MIYLGTDIVDIERFAGLMARWGDRFVERIFTPPEIEYCMRHMTPAIHFAGRFAAKEAVRKALHAAGRRTTVPFLSINIQRNDIGVPLVTVAGQDGLQLNLSISHTRTIAVAMVTVETRG